MLYNAIRPLLFSLDAEKAHSLTLSTLDKAACLLPTPKLDSSPLDVMGIRFPNPIGLAAGLDKNGEHVASLSKFGFGFIEIGTVTPKPQEGNPKPRLFRIPKQQAIINRMGFNNHGVEALVNNVKKTHYKGVLGINIGKNKDTPNEQAVDDYLIGLQQVYPHADYITINISSPNTVDLRALQSDDNIKILIEALKKAQLTLSLEFGYKPIVIKIAPDLTDEAVIGLANILKSHGVDGVIATNTTIDKTAIVGQPYAQETGGLSGAPLAEQSTHVISLLSSELGHAVPIIGVGGIMSVSDAQEKIDAGASLVQIYTGLIYQGPCLVKSLISNINIT